MANFQHDINRALQADSASERRQSARTIKIVYGTLALIAAAAAAATSIFADRFGLAQDTRDTISLGFLIAAILETGGLLFWDRLFPTE